MRIFSVLLFLTAAPLHAHEFWIAPGDYTVDADSIVTADLVNGEEFDGINQSYLPRNFARFVLVSGEEFANVTGRIGDTPALKMNPIADGLHVAAYISRPLTLTYETWEKFQKFVDHKDLGPARALHEERGLPFEKFSELYTRYSKSLIGVGAASGADRFLGMETELVALSNPYTQDGITEMTLQLYYQRELRRGVQVEIFERSPSGDVNIFRLRTDPNGEVTVPVKAGHEYMADSVVLREPSETVAATTGAAWETLWANLTWAIP